MNTRPIIICALCISLAACSNGKANMQNNEDGIIKHEENAPFDMADDISSSVSYDKNQQNDNIDNNSDADDKTQDIAKKGEGYTGIEGIDIELEKPIKRSVKQVRQRLKKLGKTYPLIKEISDNSEQYPDKMLEALANNPEMAEFVAGYLDKPRSNKSIELTENEIKQEYPLFLQWDFRWGYHKYGSDSNIGLAGCGPTCLSMALFYLKRDKTITPDKIADYSMEHGYFVEGTGTAWSLMEDVPALYNIFVTKPSISEESIKNELDKGKVIICAMGKGDFTAAGHFIVIYGYKKKGFLVNDPNCIARSNKLWKFDELNGQIRNAWAYSKKADSYQRHDIGDGYVTITEDISGSENEKIYQIQSK